MNVALSALAWNLGDDIDTGVLIPGGACCPESVVPDFTYPTAGGNIVVAGCILGAASSSEQCVRALKSLGVRAVLARSFSRAFYRNAINLGMPALFFPWDAEIATGDELEIVPAAGDVRNVTTGQAYFIDPLPRSVMRIIKDGGLTPHLKKKLARRCSKLTWRWHDDVAH
jgi:3-isopropylmalate/(R)-2-methylmalate dehydratase small subunit